MATQTHVLLIDDIDGSEAAGTVRFGLDGQDWELDLSKSNSETLRKSLAEYIEKARKATPASKRAAKAARLRTARLTSPAVPPSNGSASNETVRAWAKSQKIKCSDRGRISAEVIAAYKAAH